MTASALACAPMRFLVDRDSISPPAATTLSERAMLDWLTQENPREPDPRLGSLGVALPWEMPTWLESIHSRLEDLLSMPANWDSYGGKRIDPRRAQLVLDILDAVMTDKTPVPALVPTSNGGLQLEWHVGQVDLEVEAVSPLKLAVAFEDLQTGNEWEHETYDFQSVVEALDLMTQRQARG